MSRSCQREIFWISRICLGHLERLQLRSEPRAITALDCELKQGDVFIDKTSIIFIKMFPYQTDIVKQQNSTLVRAMKIPEKSLFTAVCVCVFELII